MSSRVKRVMPAGEYCNMPETCDVLESSLYQHFHGVHCAQRANAPADHKCAGKVTVDVRGVTFTCPLCGDARKVY